MYNERVETMSEKLAKKITWPIHVQLVLPIPHCMRSDELRPVHELYSYMDSLV